MLCRCKFMLLALLLLIGCPILQPALAQFTTTSSPPGFSEALPYYNLGNKLLNDGRYQEAASNYEQAVKLYAKDADFFVNLGVAYRKLDCYVAAEKAFKRAIALNGNDWMSWSNLGNAYLKQDKLDATISAFKEALKRNPPAAEKQAILRDIQDINKILNQRKQAAAAIAAAQKKSADGSKKVSAAKAKPKANGAEVVTPQPVPAQPAKDWGY